MPLVTDHLLGSQILYWRKLNEAKKGSEEMERNSCESKSNRFIY